MPGAAPERFTSPLLATRGSPGLDVEWRSRKRPANSDDKSWDVRRKDARVSDGFRLRSSTANPLAMVYADPGSFGEVYPSPWSS
jgi:hypothetical protein